MTLTASAAPSATVSTPVMHVPATTADWRNLAQQETATAEHYQRQLADLRADEPLIVDPGGWVARTLDLAVQGCRARAEHYAALAAALTGTPASTPGALVSVPVVTSTSTAPSDPGLSVHTLHPLGPERPGGGLFSDATG